MMPTPNPDDLPIEVRDALRDLRHADTNARHGQAREKLADAIQDAPHLQPLLDDADREHERRKGVGRGK